jgi:hypothetical protein
MFISAPPIIRAALRSATRIQLTSDKQTSEEVATDTSQLGFVNTTALQGSTRSADSRRSARSTDLRVRPRAVRPCATKPRHTKG